MVLFCKRSVPKVFYSVKPFGPLICSGVLAIVFYKPQEEIVLQTFFYSIFIDQCINALIVYLRGTEAITFLLVLLLL